MEEVLSKSNVQRMLIAARARRGGVSLGEGMRACSLGRAWSRRDAHDTHLVRTN